MTILINELLDSFRRSTSGFEDSQTLPPEIYTNEEFLDFERQALFDHEWLCVGLASSVPNVGDWVTKKVNGEPLIVARGKDEEIRVFSAVCQHRAMQLCEGSGNDSKFTCPYHHWSYALDGRLLGAPAMEKTQDFKKPEWGLPNLRVEIWSGFIFINFDENAEPLAPTMSRYEPYLSHYSLDTAVCPGTFTLESLPWNWKIMFENFNDGYHANRLHKYVQDFCPSDLSSFPVPWEDSSNVIFRESGYVHIDGGFNPTHKALFPVYPELTEEERWRSTFALVPPTLCIGTAPDQAFFFIVTPVSAGVIDLEVGYLFHPTALEHPLFDELLGATDAGVQVFIRQDQDATTKVQNGLVSRFAPRGRYSWQEESHVQFNKWLVQRYEKNWPNSCES